MCAGARVATQGGGVAGARVATRGGITGVDEKKHIDIPPPSKLCNPPPYVIFKKFVCRGPAGSGHGTWATATLHHLVHPENSGPRGSFWFSPRIKTTKNVGFYSNIRDSNILSLFFFA